eukprot:9243017-Lingulodinium_polyedra.AAC.1
MLRAHAARGAEPTRMPCGAKTGDGVAGKTRSRGHQCPGVVGQPPGPLRRAGGAPAGWPRAETCAAK